MLHKPELLSPAGSWEAMVAAVRAGADAVYLGVGNCNARRRAVNFAVDSTAECSLASAVAYCHARGVAVHAAVNILIREDELPEALLVVRAACDCGADALIVADRGLARRIRAAAPGMPLHASTQLSCHTPSGVRLLREDGFSRVVLSREMTREEITACAGLGCELEVFAYGALCMSVSGQCELSAVLGGRSGNRGLCAQPCRLPFAVGHAPHGEAALSLKDLSLVAYAHDLAALPVDSLKIEGRMKRPEYVAAATACFRRALDGQAPDPDTDRDRQAVFSRSGFTDGYYTGQRGASLFGVRRKEDVTAADAAVLSRLSRLYDKECPRVPVTLSLTVREGVPATLTLADTEGHTVTVRGAVPEPARTVALNASRAAEQLSKTGGTPFFVTAADMAIGEGLSLPVAALNALRREAIEALLACRAQPVSVPFSHTLSPRPVLPGGFTGQLVRVADVRQISGQADNWVVPLGTRPDVPCWGVEIPRGQFGQEDSLRRRLSRAAADGAAFALCGTVNALPLAVEAGLPAIGGMSLNITNGDALAAAADSGAQAAILSPELSFPQMAFARGLSGVGLFVYGRMPLMLMRSCPVAAVHGCAVCKGTSSLTDRRGASFPIRCSGGCSELLNSVPLYLADRLNSLPHTDFTYFHFTDEAPDRVAQVLEEYRFGGTPPAAFTRGLYEKGTR